MPFTLFNPPDAQSQFDSAASGGDGAGSAPPPIQPQPQGLDGETPPPVIPTIDPRPPLTPPVAPPPLDTRVQDLELQVFDLQSVVARMRDEVANLAKVAGMASDEAQQAALRMDSMEHEWLVWGDGGPQGDPAPQQSGLPGGTHPPLAVSQQPHWAPLTPTVLTPNDFSPRTQEAPSSARCCSWRTTRW